MIGVNPASTPLFVYTKYRQGTSKSRHIRQLLMTTDSRLDNLQRSKRSAILGEGLTHRKKCKQR